MRRGHYGKHIAFASTRGGSSHLWVVNADGTHLRRVTNEDRRVRYPCWRAARMP